MTHFPIWIPGTPIPQGSKSSTRTGVMYEANPKLRPWRQVMAAHLTAWQGTFFGMWEPFDGPLLVDVTFWMPRPKRPRYSHPAVKPDGDKLARALGDALTEAGIIKDDARITDWRIRKRYAEPGREGITIHDIRTDTACPLCGDRVLPGSYCPECGLVDPNEQETPNGTHPDAEA